MKDSHSKQVDTLPFHNSLWLRASSVFWEGQRNLEGCPALPAPSQHPNQPGLGFTTAERSQGLGTACSAPLNSHGSNECDVKPESQTVNQPGMQHVKFEWDFYPGKQRTVIIGEAERRLVGEKRGGQVQSPRPWPTCLPWGSRMPARASNGPGRGA